MKTIKDVVQEIEYRMAELQEQIKILKPDRDGPHSLCAELEARLDELETLRGDIVATFGDGSI